jgi:hypothetical protein
MKQDRRSDFQTNRNKKIYEDMKKAKEGKFNVWKLCAKYSMSSTRLHQIHDSVEAEIIINLHNKGVK